MSPVFGIGSPEIARIKMVGPACLPIEGSPQSYWQHNGPQHKLGAGLDVGSPCLPSSCDIAIVGGGYAGIATAYHILKSTPVPPKVVLLEAKEPCSGATGRNGGHLRPDFLMGAANNKKRYSAAAAAEVVRFEARHLAAISTLIRSEAIDCDFAETTSLGVFTTSEQVSSGLEAYEELRRDPAYSDALLRSVHFYTGDNAPQRTGVISAKGYFSTPAATLSPFKLIMTLVARCRDLGLCLGTHTTVVSIEDSNSDNQILTTHLGETLRAGKVVICTNAYVSTLLPEYETAIVPCRGLACHITGPEGVALPKLVSGSFAIMEQNPVSNATGYNYLVQLADNSIVVGGAHHRYDENDRESWYNNVDDTQTIETAHEYFEDDFMQRVFIGWKDSRADVSRVWTGIMGYSTDSLPHVGKVPNRNGVFVIAGFHGHGMPVILLAAEGIAALVEKGLDYEQTGLPSLYKTTPERLVSQRNDILAGRGIRPRTK